LPGFDLVRLIGAQVIADQAPSLLEVLLHVAANGGGVSVSRRLRVAPCTFVKARDVGSELVDVPRLEEAGLQQLVGTCLARKTAHAYGPVHYRAFACDCVDARSADGDRDYIDIDLGRESPVEAQLRVAGLPPFLEGGEVEEAQVDRTLDLEHIRRPQEDPGDVRLDQLEACRLEICFEVSHYTPCSAATSIPSKDAPLTDSKPAVTQFYRAAINLRTACPLSPNFPRN